MIPCRFCGKKIAKGTERFSTLKGKLASYDMYWFCKDKDCVDKYMENGEKPLTQNCSNQNQNPQNAREGESNVRTRKQSDDSSVDAPRGCGKFPDCLHSSIEECLELAEEKKGCGKDIPTGVPPRIWDCTRPCGSDPKQLCPECTQLHSNKSEANKE